MVYDIEMKILSIVSASWSIPQSVIFVRARDLVDFFFLLFIDSHSTVKIRSVSLVVVFRNTQLENVCFRSN